MRDFERKKGDLKQAVEIIERSNRKEAYRFLTNRTQSGLYAFPIARALGLETQGRTASQLSIAVYDSIHGASGEAPSEPLPGVNAPDPRIGGRACDGCGGVGDAPMMLRWTQVDRGEPVKVSVNNSGRPSMLHWLTPEMILLEWFRPWEIDTSIRFELIPYDRKNPAQIRVGYSAIDGPGGVRGMAYLPDQSVESMASGGVLSGDIIIDSADRWTTRDEVHETGEHEGGHSIGLPHTRNRADVMYAYARRIRRVHSLNDKRAKTLRYPPRLPEERKAA